jgi:hypothetical protein
MYTRQVCETVLMTVDEGEVEDIDRSTHNGVPTRLLGAKLEGAFRNPALHELNVEKPQNKDVLLDVSVHASFWQTDAWSGHSSTASSEVQAHDQSHVGAGVSQSQLSEQAQHREQSKGSASPVPPGSSNAGASPRRSVDRESMDSDSDCDPSYSPHRVNVRQTPMSPQQQQQVGVGCRPRACVHCYVLLSLFSQGLAGVSGFATCGRAAVSCLVGRGMG